LLIDADVADASDAGFDLGNIGESGVGGAEDCFRGPFVVTFMVGEPGGEISDNGEWNCCGD
jgi:hypothetical protein